MTSTTMHMQQLSRARTRVIEASRVVAESAYHGWEPFGEIDLLMFYRPAIMDLYAALDAYDTIREPGDDDD